MHVRQAPAARDTILPALLAAPLGQARAIMLAFPPPNSAITGLALTPRSWLVRTADDGARWTTTAFNDYGTGWTYLQFASATVGYAIHGYPGGNVDQLLQTTDAGRTFQAVRF